MCPINYQGKVQEQSEEEITTAKKNKGGLSKGPLSRIILRLFHRHLNDNCLQMLMSMGKIKEMNEKS